MKNFVILLSNMIKWINFEPPNSALCLTQVFNKTMWELDRLKLIDFIGLNTILMIDKNMTWLLKKNFKMKFLNKYWDNDKLDQPRSSCDLGHGFYWV